jgi:hypothetical protein
MNTVQTLSSRTLSVQTLSSRALSAQTLSSRTLSSQTLCIFPFRTRKPSFMSIRRCVYSYAYRFFYLWMLNLILYWRIHFSGEYGRKVLRNFVC